MFAKFFVLFAFTLYLMLPSTQVLAMAPVMEFSELIMLEEFDWSEELETVADESYEESTEDVAYHADPPAEQEVEVRVYNTFTRTQENRENYIISKLTVKLRPLIIDPKTGVAEIDPMTKKDKLGPVIAEVKFGDDWTVPAVVSGVSGKQETFVHQFHVGEKVGNKIQINKLNEERSFKVIAQKNTGTIKVPQGILKQPQRLIDVVNLTNPVKYGSESVYVEVEADKGGIAPGGSYSARLTWEYDTTTKKYTAKGIDIIFRVPSGFPVKQFTDHVRTVTSQ